MLTFEKKRQIREYFEIKNISYWKTREGYLDIDQYYEVLLGRMNKCLQKQEEEKRKQEEEEKRKQQEEEDKQKDLKRRLKNRLKKIRKRLNKKVKEINDSDEDSDDDIQVKPYIFFSPQLQSQFNDNLYLIEMLNQYYDTNENYKKFLFENNYEKIKITRNLHRGFTDEFHFNGFFYSGDDKIMSGCIHFYVENDKITKLSKIVEIF